MTTVVPVSQIHNLPEVQREQAVTMFLATARDRLHDAMEATTVVAIKAEVATVAEMTKQLGLSKECRDDATEMVRRAEYALAKAMRAGQANGTIRTTGESRRYAVQVRDHVADSELIPKPSIGDIDRSVYDNGSEILVMADSASPEQFEEALSEAREEGNLSRANVVRKIKGQQSGQTRTQRAEIITAMAAEGHHRAQIARHLGMAEGTLSRIATDYGISFPADVVGKVRRADSPRIVRETVNTLEGLLLALPLVKFEDLDPSEASDWTASLDQSLRALNRFNKQLKKEAVL